MMKLNLTKFIAIAFFSIAIALSAVNPLLAGTVESNTTNTAKQAAQEVIKDTGVKQQFGQSENGNALLDNAKGKANKKLNDLVEEADSDAELPNSKKLFLDNLSGKR